MDKSIADIRKDYTKASLSESDVAKNPLIQFRKWFDEAISSQVLEPNAMNLATIKKDRVSSRIVLLKDLDAQGFVFYTNYESQKGQQMANNQNVALTFFWPELERQVRIEGVVEKVSVKESTAYFHSRPRGSQIGAWVSHQSNTINSREFLEQRQEEYQSQFEGKEVPKPEYWGGYRVIPNLLEFWQGRSSRLHDRIQFEKVNNDWKIERLSP
ncbi:pyridoxamine 5'-phosphate oxidase [Marivirga atlantica]|jgi:pyridoxamine 5'-phosphate oxidase|uniref:Pyridoxine/pyridoxamine 5'-phosphate oxidase n=1 Tax=Marivirga atlantica TaxID=1548457 RepID=A0A937AIT3_9BACT|nr:pyridoxamine 5'-phosphate oxidase [Marivirga atlantica]MBL0766958.1 pyridoxamine 5'-phosphate oxidase [Marivirga atlantica]